MQIEIAKGTDSESTVKLMESLAGARYYSKRSTGTPSLRTDGSQCSVDTDRESVAAEYFAAQYLGCPFNATVSSKGDGGSDFVFKLSIEVVWLGVDKKTGKPRIGGNLIVNPHEPQRWADIYVVVQGSIKTGFHIVGWTTHNELIKRPKVDFGYGDRFRMPVEDLYDFDLLDFRRKQGQ